MTSIAQIRQLEEMGVDFAGLIFYPKSPRYVVKMGLDPSSLKKANLKINRVGVFVNEPEESLLQLVDEWRLDMVQLHGDESPRYCERISNHINTIKAFRINADQHIPYKVYPFEEAADMYLFDTLSKLYGGSGEQFDWELLRMANIRKPYLLSGGIGPDDAGKIREFVAEEKNLFAIDLNSKFESSPGVKNMEILKPFVQELKSGN